MTRYEAFIQKSWRDSGITQLLVARIRSDGRAEIGFFLVDLWCLGIKDAFLCADDTETAFQRIVSEQLPEETRERIHPACAKKLIDGALAYAESLGFAPARDYRKARRALSGLDTSACPETFVFGRDGKPCYAQGPEDDMDRVNRVFAILTARCGANGFDYILADTVADEGPETDALAAREALREDFEAFGPEATDFFETVGLVTALQICPTPVTPSALLDVLFGPGGRTWSDEDELREFTANLFAYWNHIAGLLAACASAPDDDPDANPIDLYYDDFDDSDPKTHNDNMASAQVLWCEGFVRATVEWPAAWGDALNRHELAPHWKLIRAWAEPEKPENLKFMFDASRSGSGTLHVDPLRVAVLTLLRALRPPGPPPS